MNTVLFDLDGTLLPMDQEIFINSYMEAITKKISPLGYAPKAFMKALWAGTEAMVRNDGSMTNETRFWKVFAELLGNDIIDKKPFFDEFYEKEFKTIGEKFIPNPLSQKCVAVLIEKGYTVVAATNPLFPIAATLARLEWAKVDAHQFNLITSYEKSSFCKPNLDYYSEILSNIGKKPEDCIMIGNDVDEDMCAAKLGMDTFLLTDSLINKHEADISGFRQGDMAGLYDYLNHLPRI